MLFVNMVFLFVRDGHCHPDIKIYSLACFDPRPEDSFQLNAGMDLAEQTQGTE